MSRIDVIAIVSLVLSAIGLLVAVLSGLINPFAASIAGVAVMLLSWMAWITARILGTVSRQDAKAQKTIVLTSDSIPYTPYYTDFSTQIVMVDTIFKKTKIPANFLDWPKFTIIFWAEITEAFFRTHNNRYLAGRLEGRASNPHSSPDTLNNITYPFKPYVFLVVSDPD